VKKMNQEPTHPKNDSSLIFAMDQNQSGFIDPKFVKPVDEHGNPLERRLPKEKVVISHYWIKKRKQIAVLGAFSCLAIVSILVQETGIFDTIFNTLSSIIGLGFGYVWGIFF